MNQNNNIGHPVDFSQYFSLLPIAVFVADDQGQIIFCNKACLTTIGSIEGKPFESVLSQRDSSRYDFKAVCKEVLSGENPESRTVLVTNPSTHLTSFYKLSARLFLSKYVLFSALDQTEKIELQRIIEDKKKQFYSIINSLGDVVFKLDREGNIKNIWGNMVSGPFLEVNPLEGTNISENFPKKVVDTFLTTIRKAIDQSKSTEVEFSYSLKGIERWFSLKITPIQNQDTPAIEEVIAIVKEVTEDKKFKQQIDYKNRLINHLTSIQNGPLLHVIEEDSLRFNFISGNLSSLTGNSDREFSGKNWLNLIHEDDRSQIIASLKELRSSPVLSNKNLVYRIVGSEGNINWVNNYISKADDGGRKMLIGVILNVTEIQLLNEKLKRRERILTNTSQVALIGGWEFDFKNNQFHLTDELYQIHEREPSEFDVRESPSYYSKEHQALIQRYLDDLIKRGKSFDDELQLITGKGDKKWIRTVGCAEWHDGQISHVYGILQDIHEKKEKDLILQENEKRFNAAFELAPLGIGLLSPEGQWLRVNVSLTHFFELPSHVLIKTSLQKLKLTDDKGKDLDWSRISKANELTYQSEEKYRTKSETIKWGRVSISPVKSETGEALYFILQVVDITESKQYEENLIIARKEAEEANKIKTDFLSTMTHEIRTPLFGVVGITNLLLDEIHDPQHREQLKALKFSSDSLLLLVNDILDFSKIKSGVLSIESKSFDLKRLVEAIEELNIPRSKEKANKIIVDYDDQLSQAYMGDELRIGQILNNLVNNAVKFTKSGFIEISIRKIAELENQHRLSFSVKDNGIGIPKDTQPIIFDLFTQGDDSISRHYGGTGLGLSIVKGLLLAMNSEVKLNSDPGKGTMISFELSLEKSKIDPQRLKENYASEHKNLQNKTVLLVEDNPVNMSVASNYLKKWNINIIQAVDGRKAVEQFLDNMDTIDLVLMDLNLPILNGYEAAEQIKNAKPDIPIVALTASTEIKERLPSFIQAYLVKPFSPRDFYRLAERYLA